MTKLTIPVVGALLLLVAGASVAGDAATAPRALRASLAPLATGALSTHDPFGSDDCAACHAAADKAAPGPVKDTTSALCLECHDDPAPDAKHRHGGPDGRCTDCHNPHNAIAAKLLHAPIATLCSSCHTGIAPASRTRPHAPLSKDASCTACHAPHGADEVRLLTSPLAPTFYAPYRREAYALCFGCHEPALVEEGTTLTATRFREGARNLHTVHVVRSDGKGRTCRACHDAHAADGAALVPDSVAFGSHGWRLPLSFRPSATGGGCARTCHLERRYDRGTPSPTPPQQETP